MSIFHYLTYGSFDGFERFLIIALILDMEDRNLSTAAFFVLNYSHPTMIKVALGQGLNI